MTDTVTEGVTDTTEVEGTTPLTEAPATTEAPAAEAAGEEGKPAEVKDSEADTTTEDGAPEEYEDFVIPENMELNQEMVDAFKPIAKELDLPQDKAQKFVDLWSEGQKEQAQATEDYWNNVMVEWQTTAKNDKEIGGQAFDDNIASAKRALDTFGTTELLEALETTGMGNHPEIIRVLARVGKAIGEDKIHVGNANSPTDGPRDPAKVLFSDMN